MIDKNVLFKNLFSEKAITKLYDTLIDKIKNNPDIYAEVSGKKIMFLANAVITISTVEFSAQGIIIVDYTVTAPGVTILNNKLRNIFKYDMLTGRYTDFNTNTKLDQIVMKDAYPELASFKVPYRIALSTTTNKMEILLGK